MSRQIGVFSKSKRPIILDEIPDDDGDLTDIENDFDEDIVSSEENDNVFDAIFSKEVEKMGILTTLLPEDCEDFDQTEPHSNQENVFDDSSPQPGPSKCVGDSETIRKWNKTPSKETSVPDYSLDQGVVDGFFEGCESPTQVFVKLIEDMLGDIVFQSNLYATQNNKTLNLKIEELYSFIGINFFMGYHRLPNWRHYWSTSPDLGVSLVSETMSRNRFDAILSSLHVNDNSSMPKETKDKLYKLKPMISFLNQRFRDVYHGSRQLSVDESIILFKGRSSMKQYNPMKPIKRGYKLWCLADNRGYIKKFSVYQGKNEEMEGEFSGYGLGERVVLSLCKEEFRKSKIVFFDNYFTSVPLLEKLRVEETWACGTVRSNRKGLPSLVEDKTLKRGEYDCSFSSTGVGFFKWKDTKCVHLCSNFHGSESTEVKRKNKDGTTVSVKCPQIIVDYNNYMGGVDHADRLRVAYGLNRRSKKWWHRIFWGLLDIAFVNAYIIHSHLHEKQSLLEFRRNVSLGLMTFKLTKKKGFSWEEKRC